MTIINHQNKINIQTIFDKLDFEELYLVGGSVRDLILGRWIKDYDFAVPYTPIKIKELLKKCGIEKTFDVGMKYGTIGCKIDDLDIEITSMRGESYNYLDRKPEVSYIQSIEEDVKRRDFTINSFYLGRNDILTLKSCYKNVVFNDKHREEGLTDLKNRIIRTVGKPGLRFKEDPLRMLRAIRFAAQLNFKIEEKTFDMIQRMRVELLKISVERWVMELDKILSLPNPNLKILADSCLLDIMIPELSYQVGFEQNSKYHDFNLWEHTVKVVEATPYTDLNLRWAALLHDIGKPFVKTLGKQGNFNYMGHEVMSAWLVKQIGLRLKWPRERTIKISELVEHHLNDYCELKKYDKMGKKND